MHGSGTRCAGSRPNAALKQQHRHHQHHHHHQQKQKQQGVSSSTRRRPQNHQTQSTSNSTAASSSKRTSGTSDSSSNSEDEDESSNEDEEATRVLTAMYHHARLDWKLGLLYTLLVLQLLLVMVYVTSTPHSGPDGIGSANGARDTVSFVEHELPPQATEYVNKSPKSTSNLRHHQQQQQSSLGSTITGDTWLREHKTSQFYDSYNGTLCWRSGTSSGRMKRDMRDADGPVDKCACEPGWHGSDCGQPEVVWRAIMASKQPTQLSRRKLARRVVHAFFVHQHNTAIAEVIVEELYHVVDLFVVCDLSLAEDNFHHKLAKGFLAKQQDKILYVNLAGKAKRPSHILSKHAWDHVRRTVRNIREDDLYVTTDAEQIVNSRALQFLAAYDGWPQPIGFRLRWSVFGFFWQHPSRTAIALGACSVGLLREAFHNFGLEREQQQQLEGSSLANLGLVIGDLNHYGGWYCQFCQGPANVVVALKEMNSTSRQMLQLERPSPDVAFIEELIGAGTWFDEKTSLLRAHRSSESYYAPETVMNQTWKYDWLLENFYAKLDYY